MKNSYLGKKQILRRRLMRPGEQLRAVDDLQNARLVGAVAEVDAVALRPGGDRAVQLGRHRAARSRLLPREAEIADEFRLRRIRQVEDLGHAPDAPVGQAG